jgi:ribosomal-protein-alanine N-acetyltransferase
MKFITGGTPWSDERIQEFVARQRKSFQEQQYCRWKIILKETGELIGFCGVGRFREELDPEIGWWLAKKYWRQGLAFEAAQAAFADITGRIGMKRVTSVAHKENRGSTRIMEKLGLKYERPVVNPEGWPLVMYSCELSQPAARSTEA